MSDDSGGQDRVQRPKQESARRFQNNTAGSIFGSLDTPGLVCTSGIPGIYLVGLQNPPPTQHLVKSVAWVLRPNPALQWPLARWHGGQRFGD